MSEFTTTKQGYQSLHDAVRNGCLEEVRYFLDSNPGIVNQKDESGNTPLLLAVCISEDRTYNDIVSYLIDKGADVNVYNKGFTPLYHAVFYKREASTEMLLKAGAWLRPTYRNELHLVAETGGSSIMKMILEDVRCTPQIVNAVDEEGNTALHIAARFQHVNCLKLLATHGGSLTANNNDNETVLDIIFEQLVNPEHFLIELLNESIIVEETAKYKCCYKLDFSVLAPKNCDRQMEIISAVFEAASEEQKIEILQNPLVELFLVFKWSKICCFFHLWISIYAIFAISIGTFSYILIHKCDNIVLVDFIKWILILSSAGLLAHALLQCLLVRKNYIQRYEMWINIVCTSFALTVATSADIAPTSDLAKMPKWILHFTSIAVLLAWIKLMLLIGRLPSLGYYALMFSAVLQNVIKVLLAFIFLLVGFVLSFSIQFSNVEDFANPWKAFIKTVVMMMGEYEYSNFFSVDEEELGRFYVARIVFLFFIILTSIVLMNLMVGLAVSDIQELHKQGRTKKLEKQAEFLNQLEKVICYKHLNRKPVPAIVRNILVKRSFINTTYVLKTSVEFQRTEGIPRRIIDSVAAIAKRS